MATKVLPFNLFSGEQKNIPAKDEPSHIAAASDVVLIATKLGKIQVYDRSNDSPLLFEFKTMCSSIYGLQYMNENGYIITIEKERDQSAINVIRVYINWRNLPQEYDLIEATKSLTPVKSTVPLKEVQDIVPERYKLLVYTLPIPSSVQILSICPVSNYIAACTDKVISIYSAKVNSAIEWVLDIKADNVKRVVLYDCYLAYYTDKEVFALKLKMEKVDDKQPLDVTNLSQMVQDTSQPRVQDNNETMHSVAFKNIEIQPRKLTLSRANSQTFNTDSSQQKYSYYEEDEQYIECVFDDSQIIPWININVPSLAQANTLANINAPKEILGPIKDIHIVSVNVEDNFKLRSSLVMYYKRLAPSEIIQQVCLVPEYLDAAGVKNKLSGMRLLVSTTRQGALYDISNNTHHIITFNYSDDIIDCVASPMFLYSITETGLEIFAMRATRSSFDDNSMPTTKPCIIGIQPFNGLKSLIIEKDTLVLMCLISEAALLRKMSQKIDVKGMAKSPAKKEDAMGWNIYTLQHTTASDIFNQIAKKAESSRDNPTVEYQLLLEAHALVSSALSSSQEKQTENEQQPLSTLLKYCNGLLAGYCLRTDNYSNATSLFFQSEVRPLDVCNQFVEKIRTGVSEENSTSSKKKFDDPIMSLHTAFDQYLNSALFANDGTFEFSEQDKFMADLILDHYCRFNPFKLGKVILESSLSLYNKEVAINYLEKSEQDKNLAEISLWEMKIALVVLYLACDYRDKALTLLNKIPQNLLVYYCSQNPKLLDAGEHTLGKALRECSPWTLLEILVRIDDKQYDLLWDSSRRPVRQNRFSSTLGLLANASQLEQLEQQLNELNEQRKLLQKQLEAQKDQSQELQTLNEEIEQLKAVQRQQEEQLQHYKTEGANEDTGRSSVGEVVQAPSKSSVFALSPLTIRRLSNEVRFKNESRILSMCYLEALLIEKSKKHAQSPSEEVQRDIEVLFTRLSKVYYEILLLNEPEEIDNLYHQLCNVASDQETDSTQSKRLSFEYIWKYFHVHCFNAFPRHKWLEQLPPLNQLTNHVAPVPDSSPTASLKNIELALGFTEQQLKADQFYLRKFQTILSSDVPRHSHDVLALIESEYARKDYLLFSLRLLALPRVHRLPDGVDALIASVPSVIIDYLKHYCHKKEDWAVVLGTLWRASVNLETKLSSDGPSASDEELINQYTIILNHTAKQLAPDEFLALLPIDGDLKFFLPFIETNFRLYKSNKLLNRIQKQALKEQEEL